MARAFKILWIGITLVYVSSLVSSTTWIYNAPRALFGLASSASASASAPMMPSSVIADLRRREEKSAQLQEEKDGVHWEGLSEEENDEEESNNENSEGNNEASPSLLQKKIGKVLTKLRLIAQIKNAYHYRPEDHEHDTNITLSSRENNDSIEDGINNQTQQNPANNTGNVNITEIIKPRIVSINNYSQSENIQHISKLSSEKMENEPVKIDLDVNQLLGVQQTPQNKKLKEHEPGRLGALGVFFAELVGSVVGLTYGAVAQITSGGQNPVTISTSEGL